MACRAHERASSATRRNPREELLPVEHAGTFSTSADVFAPALHDGASGVEKVGALIGSAYLRTDIVAETHLRNVERDSFVRKPRSCYRSQAVCNESSLERCTVQVLRQGLRANVLAGALAGKDMTASWPRAERLLSGDQLLQERREGHAKWPSLLHVLSWYVDRVFCDPRLLERSILARTEHRAEREEEEHAHALWRFFHNRHNGGQLSPVYRWHRLYLRRREDL